MLIRVFICSFFCCFFLVFLLPFLGLALSPFFILFFACLQACADKTARPWSKHAPLYFFLSARAGCLLPLSFLLSLSLYFFLSLSLSLCFSLSLSISFSLACRGVQIEVSELLIDPSMLVCHITVTQKPQNVGLSMNTNCERMANRTFSVRGCS